jgi:hypothetical protein
MAATVAVIRVAAAGVTPGVVGVVIPEVVAVIRVAEEDIPEVVAAAGVAMIIRSRLTARRSWIN